MHEFDAFTSCSKVMIYKGKKINMNKKIYVLIVDFEDIIRHFGL